MSAERKRIVLVVALSAMLVLAGCVGANDTGDVADGGDAADTGDELQFEADAQANLDDDADGTTAQERHVIRTGSVHLEVDDFEAVESSVRTIADDHGGYVSDSDRRLHRQDNRTWTTGTVEIRVPEAEFDAAHSAVESEGTVVRSTTESQDVTEQITDLEARLANLEAERDRLRELYEDAEETSDVLQVQSELSDVQGEIERIETELRTVEDRVSYSTITVHIEEPEPDADSVIDAESAGFHETPLTEAFVSSVNALVVLVRGTGVLLAYLAPFALLTGVPVVAGYVAWSRRRDGGA